MGEELTASKSKAGVHCGACGHTSAENARFCAGCGQSLFEDCGGCGKPVLLDQKFCGLCGSNLEQELQRRMDQVQGWMGEAVDSAKQHSYDHAIMLLSRASDAQDYRFDELASQAKQAVEKVKDLRRRAESTAEELYQKAKAAFDSNEHGDAARLVQQIPEPLRNDEAKQILANSVAFLGQESSLVGDLQASIKENDWILAGSLLGQAIDLSPDDPQYKNLGAQVSDKLYKLSVKYLEKCDYEGALQCLDSIPSQCHSSDHDEQHNKVNLISWLSNQFEDEAFATATLGRLAVRLTKEAPHDESAKNLVKHLATQVKQKAETPRDPYSPWKTSRESWCGGPAGFLAYPQSVKYAADSKVRKVPGRFSVAIGLAAQGLGFGRIKQQFVETKGLLSGFRRKKNSVWGIDIGASTIAAVLINKDEEGTLNIEQDYFATYETPICRTGQKHESEETIRHALELMLEEIELGEAPVWINLPAGDLVTRFVRLPPLGDKQAKAMLKVEAEQRIPLAMEDLRVIEWIADIGEHEVTGRPASISAARKSVVEKRMELCEEAGLKVSGMQSDALALVNFADLEFAELWAQPDAEDEGDGDGNGEGEDNGESDGNGESEGNGEGEGDGDADGDQTHDFDTARSTTDSVLLLDAGAETTTLVIVSNEAFWFWNAESGGELLTTAVVSNSKLVVAEAEQKKMQPAKMDDPRAQFVVVERRLIELRARLEKMVDEAKNQNERFHIVQSWCIGGSCLTHQWIRRIMLK